MPENYTPPGSDITYVVPALDDPADGPHDFRQFADSIPASMSTAIPVHNVSSDHILTKEDVGCLVAVDTTAGKVLITVPKTLDADVPVGSVINVSNVGSNRDNKVTIVGDTGVTVKDPRDRDVSQYRMTGLMKTGEDFWLIVAGSGSGEKAKEPLPPQNAKAYGTPGGVLVTWEAPSDDGGSPVSLYKVEQKNGNNWDVAATVEADKLFAQINGLTVGTVYAYRVLAINGVGPSDPSSIASATPTQTYNSATGGTESVYTAGGKTYKRHVFTSDGTLSVKTAGNPFTVAVIGAGGSGGGGWIGAVGYGGGHGGGGGGFEKPMLLAVKDYAAKIGVGGAATGYNVGGKKGGSTSFAELVAGGGGGGQSGQSYQDAGPVPQPGDKGSEGGTSDGGSGAGSGFTFPGDALVSAYKLSPIGQGGAGGNQDGPGGGGAGQNGAVIVTYEVAPFNNATGGIEKIVPNYNGTGKTYKTHTFTGNDTLTVHDGFNEFKVLVVGQGGQGGPVNRGGSQRGGGGGGGGGFLETTTKMDGGDKVYPIIIGASSINGISVSAGGGGEEGGGGGGGHGASSGAPTSHPGGGQVGDWGGSGGGGAGGKGAECEAGGGGTGYTGSDGGPGLPSNITGANATYGAGGHGGGHLENGRAGQAGVVIVAYEVPATAQARTQVGEEPTYRIARILRAGEVVESIECASTRWMRENENDPWFHFVKVADDQYPQVGDVWDPVNRVFIKAGRK